MNGIKLKKGISAVTITYNEEANIEKFIVSHKKVADEIIVIDSGSYDDTIKLAKNLGAIVINNPWPGYAKQWNFGIKKCNYEWIIIGDADHYLTDDVAKEINYRICNEDNDAYYIPRKNIFFGKWLKHGGFYPDTPYARMFRNGYGCFDEKQMVHEKLKVQSDRIGRMKSPIVHNTYTNFENYISKMNKYTTLEAEIRNEKESKVINNSNKFIDKSQIKRKLPFRPIIMFLYRYILRLGFLDGKLGFIMAILSGYYEFVSNIKAWENKIRLKNEL